MMSSQEAVPWVTVGSSPIIQLVFSKVQSPT